MNYEYLPEHYKLIAIDLSKKIELENPDLLVNLNADSDTDIAFKICAPFSTCKTERNDVFVDEAIHIYIAMPMYNFIEYSDNY